MLSLQTAKLHIPSFRSQVLPRPQFWSALDSALEQGQSVCISAPAGWGKTSALALWAARQPATVCWYSLDQHDSDPVTFLHYLLTSLIHGFPRLREVLPLVESPSQQIAWQQVFQRAVEVINAERGTCVLVLDNVDVLSEQGSAELLACVEQLILAAPMRLILTSCRVLGGLAGAVVRGHLHMLARQLLDFSAGDICALTAARYGQALAPPHAERLAAWADGWPAAVCLALEDWRRRGVLEDAHPQILPEIATSYLYTFLAEQVFAPLDPQLQRFLVETALLEELTAPRCDELRQTDNAHLFLNILRHNGLFVEIHGAQLRYNELFRAFLLSRLAANPEQQRVLLRRSAELHQRWEYTDVAFQQWLALGDLPAASALVRNSGQLLRQRGQHTTVQGWLAALQTRGPLPADLRLLWACVAMDQADWDTTHAMLRLAVAGCDPNVALEARLLEASVACVCQDHTRASEIMRGIDLEALPPALRMQGLETAGRVALTQGAVGQAVALFKQALLHADSQTGQQPGGPPAHLYDLLGMACAMQDDAAAAAHYLQQANAIWRSLGAPVRQVNTLNNLAALAIEEGRLDEAGGYLREGLELAERYQRPRSQALLMCGMAEIELIQTNFEAALELYRRAYAVAIGAKLIALQAYICAGALRAAVLGGDLLACDHWDDRLDRVPAGGLAAYPNQVYLARALSAPDPAAASKLLEQIALGGYLANHDRAQYLLLRAQTACQQGGWDAAVPAWHALEQHQPRRFLDPLLRVQCRRTPQLLAQAPATPLASRLRNGVQMVAVVPAPAVELASPPPARWRFVALGRFAITSADQPDQQGVRPIDQLVIVRLLEAGPAGLPVLRLWSDIWGERDYSADSLRQSMTRIRRVSSIALQLRNSHCQMLLPWDQLSYDVALFERTPRLQGADSRADIAALERQLALYQGSFLGHLHHESAWLEVRRDTLHQHALALRERLGELLEPLDPQRALQHYRAVLADNDCRERAAAGAMRCCGLLGDRSQAVALYQQTRRALDTNLGIDPSTELEQLYRTMI
ncbi:MAG: BTAD domain-containing putative transcriptional regulator [Roseiflexaceae bacterium]